MRLRVVVTAHGGTGDGLHRRDAEAGVRARRPRPGRWRAHQDPGREHVEPPLRRPARRRPPGAAAGHERRRDPRLPLGHDRAAGVPAARPTCRRGGRRRRRPRVADHIPIHRGAFGVGAPAVGDLYRDGHLEIVDTDLDGKVYVWSATGQRLATMSVNPAYSRDDPTDQDEYNRTKPGFASSPSLGDLDGDGKLEIVAAAMDRHVYAWHADGTPVAGLPGAARRSDQGVLGRPGQPRGDVHARLGRAGGRRADRHTDGGRRQRRRAPRDRGRRAGAVRRAAQHRRRRRRARPPRRGRHARQLAAVRGRARRHRCRLPQLVGQPRCPGLPPRLAGQAQPAGHVAAADHRRRRGHAGGGRRRRRQPPRPRDRGRVVGRHALRARRPRHERLRRHVDRRPPGGLGRWAGAPARIALRRQPQLEGHRGVAHRAVRSDHRASCRAAAARRSPPTRPG